MDTISSIINQIDKLKNFFTNIKADNNLIKRLSGLLLDGTSVQLLLALLLQHWNLLAYSPSDPLPMFSSTLSSLLLNYIQYGIVFWLVYHYIVYSTILRIILKKYQHPDSYIMRRFSIFDDLIELFTAIFFFLYGTNELLCFANYGHVLSENKIAYYFFSFYFIYQLIHRINILNTPFPHGLKKEYSDYFDHNGKRIACGDYVIFYNKLFQVIATKSTQKFETIGWMICRREGEHNYSVHKLEDALNDKDGHLVVATSEQLCGTGLQQSIYRLLQ